ncbi:DUF4279 domain-containing protein [Micromonospora endophytica]|uniref:Uncharacterized protein n=1 Tax=Micromonospora endophytica TaxID=515350 RepID=A0A2W2D1D5_9ACTN|nr:DUF4279 domain-containing protein [Micromonospora endophytica]PZF94439.1 hypothetical protein C1I93_16555 [Micromonospora endophytica]RIW42651.1 DUF4279 domain-containing protein [Micromonospora endophytica]BCJ60721.1 hypothetical protein Jiend_41430 [Micromonospora endophytica]
MRVHQYAYFALRSERLSAQEMTARVGLEPDRVTLRGSRIPEIPIPRAHGWEVTCPLSASPIDEQVSWLIERLAPYQDRIGALVVDLDRLEDGSTACLHLVRHFEVEEPAATSASATTKPQNGGPGLGWHLDQPVLTFLAQTGTVLDVDEYDMNT